MSRDLPSAPESEVQVLGACLYGGDLSLVEICEKLRPGDFTDAKRAAAYRAIRRLYNEGAEVAFSTLTTALQGDKAWRWGDPTGILNDWMTAYEGKGLAQHIAAVASRSVARNVIEAAGELSRTGHDQQDDPSGLLEQVQRIAFRVINDAPSDGAVLSPAEQAEQFAAYIEKVTTDPEAGGIATGYPDLDRLIALRRQEMVIVAARPSTGKTALAECIAERAAAKGKFVIFASIEMSKVQLLSRRLARQYRKMPARNFLSGKLPPASDREFWDAFRQGLVQIGSSGIWLIDDPRATTTSLRANITRARLRANQEPDLIVVDYLQLMKDRYDSEDGNGRIEFISGQIKAIAREFNVPVLCLSQLSRNLEQRKADDRVPKLSDLRGSGAIEQDADIVVFLHRATNGAERSDQTTVRVAKNRNGPIGDTSLLFRPDAVEFVSMAHNEST